MIGSARFGRVNVLPPHPALPGAGAVLVTQVTWGTLGTYLSRKDIAMTKHAPGPKFTSLSAFSQISAGSAASRGGAPRASALAALCLAGGLATVAVGCSDDKDGASAFAEYEGTWRLNRDARNVATLSCPMLTPPFVGEFPLFTQMVLQAGTVSDVFDVGAPGDCQFAFNKVPMMKALSAVTPDPFTAAALQCVPLSLGSAADPMTGNTIETLMLLRPNSWVVNLQMPVQGKAPTAQLAGQAVLDVVDVDTDAMPQAVVATSPCTYTVGAFFDKVSK